MCCSEKKYLLSSAGGSGIPIFDVLTCPMKIKNFWDGWRIKFPFYFAYGSTIHQTAFLPYSDGRNRSELPEIAKSAISEVITSGKYSNTNPKTGEVEVVTVEFTDDDIMYGAEMAEKQMEVWSERMYEPEIVESCEMKFVSDIVNPMTGEAEPHLEEVGISARLDLVLNPDGTRKLVDLKTCKSELSFDRMKEFNYLFQMGTQRYLLTQAHQKEINDLAFFQLIKNKTKAGIARHAHEVIIDGPAKLSFYTIYLKYKQAAEILLKCIRTGEWPMLSSCTDRYGAPCKYYCLCYKEQFLNPELEIAKTLYNIKG